MLTSRSRTRSPQVLADLESGDRLLGGFAVEPAHLLGGAVAGVEQAAHSSAVGSEIGEHLPDVGRPREQAAHPRRRRPALHRRVAGVQKGLEADRRVDVPDLDAPVRPGFRAVRSRVLPQSVVDVGHEGQVEFEGAARGAVDRLALETGREREDEPVTAGQGDLKWRYGTGRWRQVGQIGQRPGDVPRAQTDVVAVDQPHASPSVPDRTAAPSHVPPPGRLPVSCAQSVQEGSS